MSVVDARYDSAIISISPTNNSFRIPRLRSTESNILSCENVKEENHEVKAKDELENVPFFFPGYPRRVFNYIFLQPHLTTIS